MHIGYNNCIKMKSYVNSITFKITKLISTNSNKCYNWCKFKYYLTNKTPNFKMHLISCNPKEFLSLFENESRNGYSKSMPILS